MANTPAETQSRLLTGKQAAQYMGMCENTFRSAVPVSAVDFGGKHSSLKRYDRKQLDQWLDHKAGIANDDSLSPLERFLQNDGSGSA